MSDLIVIGDLPALRRRLGRATGECRQQLDFFRETAHADELRFPLHRLLDQVLFGGSPVTRRDAARFAAAYDTLAGAQAPWHQGRRLLTDTWISAAGLLRLALYAEWGLRSGLMDERTFQRVGRQTVDCCRRMVVPALESRRPPPLRLAHAPAARRRPHPGWRQAADPGGRRPRRVRNDARTPQADARRRLPADPRGRVRAT